MELKNNKFSVEVALDEHFDLGSPVHSKYDLVVNVDDYTSKDFDKVLSLTVNHFDVEYRVALIGSGQSYPDNCAVLENEVLTVVQDNRVIRFDLNRRSVVAVYDADLYGCAFGLYRAKDGYFIHGELEIAKYDYVFNKKWSFSGRDIFVSSSNKQAFRLLDDRVCLYDFEDNYYEVDYNGKQLAYQPHN